MKKDAELKLLNPDGSTAGFYKTHVYQNVERKDGEVITHRGVNLLFMNHTGSWTGSMEDLSFVSKLVPIHPVRTLTCTCCGGAARGRQWENMDQGFGICSDCVGWLKDRKDFPMMPYGATLNYGVEGLHFFSKEKPEPGTEKSDQ